MDLSLSTSFFNSILFLRRVMRFAMVRDSFIDLERRQQGQERPPGPKLVRLWCEFLFICARMARQCLFVKLYFPKIFSIVISERASIISHPQSEFLIALIIMRSALVNSNSSARRWSISRDAK